MRTAWMLIACLVGLAAAAEAQTGPNPYPARQTAMGALGQVGVLGQLPPGGYRVAARNGAGQQVAGRPVKPFSGLTSEPTISPYLNLFREESDNAAPNYHTFVQPMQQQYEAARIQQAQLQQLQRQVRQASYAAPTSVSGGARFGDTGRFYGGWRR